MDELTKAIRKNEKLLFLGIPIVMAVLFAFFPVADIYGKASAIGIKLVFNGNGLGVSRLFAIVALLLPIIALVVQVATIELPEKLKSNFNVIWTVGSLVFIVLMAIAFPRGVTLAWGGYLYCLFAILGIVVNLMQKQ